MTAKLFILLAEKPGSINNRTCHAFGSLEQAKGMADAFIVEGYPKVSVIEVKSLYFVEGEVSGKVVKSKCVPAYP